MKPAISQVFNEKATGIAYKVVGHSEKTEDIFAIPIFGGKATGMPEKFAPNYFSDVERFRQPDFDPYKIDKREEDLTDSEKRVRDARLVAIEKLKEDPRLLNPGWRNKEINFISKKTNSGLKRTAIFNLLKLWWVHGPDDNALLPKYENSGGSGKRKKRTTNEIGRLNEVPKKIVLLTSSDLEKIGQGYRTHFIKNPKNSLRQARIDFLATEKYKKEEAPSLKQFIYWGEAKNNYAETLAYRAGKITMQKDIRLLSGTARDNNFGPNTEYMIDSTIDNISMVQISSPDRYFGRTTLYPIVDVFSSLITGVYITPEHPSYITACLGLINSAEDKVEFCKRYSIEITHDDWPSNYVPGRLLADRGELLSNMSSTITKNLGIGISNTPSYRPDLKAYVEKQIHILQMRIKGLLYNNGLIDKNDAPRISQDSRKQAVLNMNDITKLVILEILHFNKNHWMSDYPMTPEMRAEIKEPTPINIYLWGISKGLGVVRKLDKHVMWRNCLPRRPAKVTRTGIELKPHHFTVVNAEHENILDKIRFSGKNDCEIAFHPSYFKDSYLLHEGIFYPLKLKGAVDYLNYFEFEDFVVDLNDRKTIHDREAIAREVEKRRKQMKITDDAQKRRAKKVDVNNAKEYRKDETEIQREKVIVEVQAPEDKVVKENDKSNFQQKNSPPSALPSFINDLQNLNI